jgi:hypothetical protein
MGLERLMPVRGFRPGLPQECADVAPFLDRDESGVINGAKIATDGEYIAAGTAHLRDQVRADYAAEGNRN